MSRSGRVLAAGAGAMRSALGMRFVREVTDGVIGAQAYANYLLIEESFVRTATRLHGLAVWDAPSWPAVESNARAVHHLVGAQTDYFRAARASWPVPADLSDGQTERSAVLRAHTLGAAREGGYAAVVTCLFAAETLYYTWCAAAHDQGRVPAGPIADWVALHATDAFKAGVDALASAVDELDATDERLAAWFTGTLEAEIVFHDSVYVEPLV